MQTESAAAVGDELHMQRDREDDERRSQLDADDVLRMQLDEEVDVDAARLTAQLQAATGAEQDGRAIESKNSQSTIEKLREWEHCEDSTLHCVAHVLKQLHETFEKQVQDERSRREHAEQVAAEEQRNALAERQRLYALILDGRERAVAAAEAKAAQGEICTADRPEKMSMQDMCALGQFPSLMMRYADQLERERNMRALNLEVFLEKSSQTRGKGGRLLGA